MQASLRLLHKTANIQEVRLFAETVIGRAPDCQLKIASAQISRRHCRIIIQRNQVSVEDLGSSNGTLVNGVGISPGEAVILQPGDEITIGPAQFVLQIQGMSIPVRKAPLGEMLVGALSSLSSTILGPPKTQPAHPPSIGSSADVSQSAGHDRELGMSLLTTPVAQDVNEQEAETTIPSESIKTDKAQALDEPPPLSGEVRSTSSSAPAERMVDPPARLFDSSSSGFHDINSEKPLDTEATDHQHRHASEESPAAPKNSQETFDDNFAQFLEQLD